MCRTVCTSRSGLGTDSSVERRLMTFESVFVGVRRRAAARLIRRWESLWRYSRVDAGKFWVVPHKPVAGVAGQGTWAFIARIVIERLLIFGYWNLTNAVPRKTLRVRLSGRR